VDRLARFAHTDRRVTLKEGYVMNLIIQIPDEEVPVLRARANARGVSAEQYALEVLDRI